MRHNTPTYLTEAELQAREGRLLARQESSGEKKESKEKKDKRTPVQNEYEKHRMIVRGRRDSFYSNFTPQQQELLHELKVWPTHSGGIPAQGLYEKFFEILNLDPESERANELADYWLESIGWSVVGRDGVVASVMLDKEVCPVAMVSKRKYFYNLLSIEEQNLLEEEMVRWPLYPNGNMFAGFRARFAHLLNMDLADKETHDTCTYWMESIGWSIIGRHCRVDAEGKVWGPSPFEGDLEFPYSDALYDDELHRWVLPSNHRMYNVFKPAKAG